MSIATVEGSGVAGPTRPAVTHQGTLTTPVSNVKRWDTMPENAPLGREGAEGQPHRLQFLPMEDHGQQLPSSQRPRQRRNGPHYPRSYDLRQEATASARDGQGSEQGFSHCLIVISPD